MKEARKSTKIHGKVGTYICFSCKIFGGGEVICIGVRGIFPLVFWWFWQRSKASLCRRSRRAFAIFSSIKEKKSSTQLPWLCFSFSFLASIQLPCHITLLLVSYVRIVNLLPLHAIGSHPSIHVKTKTPSLNIHNIFHNCSYNLLGLKHYFKFSPTWTPLNYDEFYLYVQRS